MSRTPVEFILCCYPEPLYQFLLCVCVCVRARVQEIYVFIRAKFWALPKYFVWICGLENKMELGVRRLGFCSILVDEHFFFFLNIFFLKILFVH